ncbi:MAG: hypothetical protein LUF29_01165 [Oscillospiraceae bacterium]|nr:hypothetical protein [Oscillospiraceae bacterium]
MMEQIEILDSMLRKDGLSVERLEALSYHSQLGINLKKNLHHFDREELFEELWAVNDWYDDNDLLQGMVIDYRVKSLQSIQDKYERYYPDHQLRKVFDDLLGFRCLCDNYEQVFKLAGIDKIRVADMSQGKAHDDGYRGVHVYYQKSEIHYPIEIQYNTYIDRQLNNWLHSYLYKKNYPDAVGCEMRKYYEAGKIRTEADFKEVLENVLSGSEECR